MPTTEGNGEGNGNPLQYTCLENPMDGGDWWATVHGVAKSQTQLSNFRAMNFTFFSSAHGTFSRIDHILGHKYSLGKFKKIEIIPSIFSDHNGVRLNVNYRKKKNIYIYIY